MEYFDMAVTLSPELQRRMKMKQKYKSISTNLDLSASDNRNEPERNKVKAFRDLLMKGIVIN